MRAAFYAILLTLSINESVSMRMKNTAHDHVDYIGLSPLQISQH